MYYKGSVYPSKHPLPHKGTLHFTLDLILPLAGCFWLSAGRSLSRAGAGRCEWPWRLKGKEISTNRLRNSWKIHCVHLGHGCKETGFSDPLWGKSWQTICPKQVWCSLSEKWMYRPLGLSNLILGFYLNWIFRTCAHTQAYVLIICSLVI